MTHMIQLSIGTNTQRRKIVVSSDTSPKAALTDQQIDYGMATVMLDGCALTSAEMNQSFDELGITAEEAMLICVVKATNA